MPRPASRPAACLATLLALCPAAPAAAQTPDCANPVTQFDMNQCAALDWERADAALNTAYRQAMAVLEGWDAGLPANLQGGPDSLRAAQRAWISFRDAACAAEGFAMRGGSAESMLVYGCMARLTEVRTQDLLGLVAIGG